MSKSNGNGKQEEETSPEEGMVKVERFEQELRVTLTSEEVAERADRAAHLVSTIDEREQSMKAQQAHAKAEIAKLQSEMKWISNEVRDKATYRDVKCERLFVFRTAEVIELRTDTGEEISRRAMYESEKQLELKLAEEQKKKAADAEKDEEDARASDVIEPPLPTEKKRKNRRRATAEETEAQA